MKNTATASSIIKNTFGAYSALVLTLLAAHVVFPASAGITMACSTVLTIGMGTAFLWWCTEKPAATQ